MNLDDIIADLGALDDPADDPDDPKHDSVTRSIIEARVQMDVLMRKPKLTHDEKDELDNWRYLLRNANEWRLQANRQRDEAVDQRNGAMEEAENYRLALQERTSELAEAQEEIEYLRRRG